VGLEPTCTAKVRRSLPLAYTVENQFLGPLFQLRQVFEALHTALTRIIPFYAISTAPLLLSAARPVSGTLIEDFLLLFTLGVLLMKGVHFLH
jgi:hypothetical protein